MILGPSVYVGGARYLPGALDRAAQEVLVADVRSIVRAAPLFQPETSRGKKLSVKMTSAGTFGWVSDRRGYRYEKAHPMGMYWPAIPDRLLALWRAVVPNARLPESCLINWYAETARMGLHQDRDEADLDQPVVSVSLGDEGLFRIGGTERSGKTQSQWLRSGDVVVLEGVSRLAFHGIDRIKPGTSTLLEAPGRINITMRVVT